MPRRGRLPSRTPCGAALLVALVMGVVGCPRNESDDPLATQPARLKWPGRTGRVNRIVVGIQGSGRAGFVISVTTLQQNARGGVRFALEDGSFVFRLYPADEDGAPIREKRMGEWTFDEAATRRRWTPKPLWGKSTFTFHLFWQDQMPPGGMPLILVTQFTPLGREPQPPHVQSFTVGSRLPAAP